MIANLKGDRGTPDHRLLRPMIAEVRHPPAPRFGCVAQHDVGVEPVMAVKTSPRQHQIQPVSLCELMHALQTGQATVGTKGEANVWSREGLYLQATERRVTLSSGAPFHPHLRPSIHRQRRPQS